MEKGGKEGIGKDREGEGEGEGEGGEAPTVCAPLMIDKEAVSAGERENEGKKE